LFLVAKILKNCLKMVEEKSMAKIAIGKFATFLTPFQASSTKICLQVKSSQYLRVTSTILFYLSAAECPGTV